MDEVNDDKHTQEKGVVADPEHGKPAFLVLYKECDTNE